MEETGRVERAASGDRDAIESIVRQLYPSIYRLMRALVASTSDAEDLTQTTLLEVVRKIGRFRGEASLRTWAGHIAVSEHRRWYRRRRLTFRLTTEIEAPTGDLRDVEAIEALRPALLALPSALREAFLLYSLYGESLEAIAIVQGVPVGTVKSRLFHARRRLSESLSQPVEEASHVAESY